MTRRADERKALDKAATAEDRPTTGITRGAEVIEKGEALIRAAAFAHVLADAHELYEGSGDAEAAAELACGYFAVQARRIIECADEKTGGSEEELARLIEVDPAEIADALRSPPTEGEA